MKPRFLSSVTDRAAAAPLVRVAIAACRSGVRAPCLGPADGGPGAVVPAAGAGTGQQRDNGGGGAVRRRWRRANPPGRPGRPGQELVRKAGAAA